MSGPLNAGTFGPDPVDPTINARVLYNETGFFNFGHYGVQRDENRTSHFTSEIRTVDGLIRPGSQLNLIATEEEEGGGNATESELDVPADTLTPIASYPNLEGASVMENILEKIEEKLLEDSSNDDSPLHPSSVSKMNSDTS